MRRFVITPGFFKRALLLLWALWFSVVTATNACDALKELGLLGPGWRFASGNFAFLADTTARYGLPGWVNAALFLGVITWEATAAVLFWLAWRQTCRKGFLSPQDCGRGFPSPTPPVDESPQDSPSSLGETRPRDVPGSRPVKDAPLLYPAFLAGLMLWGAFALADELFIAYAVEATHLRLFTAQLATLMAIVLLPECPEAKPGDAPA